MASDNDWAGDPEELAGMSRSGGVLERMGYDPDEVRINPALRNEVMQKLGSPYSADNRMESAAKAAPPVAAYQAAQAAPPQQGSGAMPAPKPTASTALSVPQTTGQSSSQVSPQPQVPQSLAMGLEGVRGALDAGKQASGVADELINDSAPKTGDLDTRIQAETLPFQYRDPKTGKVSAAAEQAGYKPGVGTEILRALRGAVVGTLTGGIPGGIVGAIEPQDIRGGTAYGAPDRAYNVEEQQREAQLAADQGRRSQMVQEFKDQTDRRKGLVGTLRDIATSDKDAASGAAEIANADSNAQRAQTDADTRRDNSPQGQTELTEAKYKELSTIADRLNLRGNQRTQYLAKGLGILPGDPRQATAEEISRTQALKVWTQNNPGKTPTLDDLNSINAAAGGRLKEQGGEAPPPEVAATIADSVGKKQRYTDGVTRLPNGNYLKAGGDKYKPADVIPAAEFNQTVEQFRLDANKALAKKGWQVDASGNTVRTAPANAAVPQTAAQASPSGNAPPAGATHVYKDPKTGAVKGYAVNGQYVAAGAQ